MPIQNKSNHSIIKTLSLIFIVAVTVIFVSNFLPAFREGYADKDKLPPLDAAEDDTDLKCPAIGSNKGCTPSDVIKLGYDLASDPATSITELDNLSKVCKSRSPELSEMASKFIGDVTLLKFSTMLNTKSNSAEIQKKLDEIKNNTSANPNMQNCYTYKFMFEMAGLQVGTADQKTISAAQSEAVRCYAQRFNAFRKCMGLCKKKVAPNE